MKLVLVTWEDSHHRPGWTTEPPAEVALICQSVGWIVFESRSVTVLCANLTKESGQQRLGDFAIPTRSIISIQSVEVVTVNREHWPSITVPPRCSFTWPDGRLCTENADHKGDHLDHDGWFKKYCKRPNA